MTTEHRVLEYAGRAYRDARSEAVARPGPAWRLIALGLVAVDGAALLTAFALAYLLRFKAGIPLLETPAHTLAFYRTLAFGAIPAWLALLALHRLYDRHRVLSGPQEYIGVVNACTSGLVAVIVISFLYKGLDISRGWLLIVWALAVLLVGAGRFLTRRLVRHLRARGALATPTVIVGANEEGLALAEQFLGDPGSGVRVVGFVDNQLPPGTPVLGGLSVLGGLRSLESLAGDGGGADVVVAASALSRDELLGLYRAVGHLEGVEVRLSSGLFEILTTGVVVQEISCVPLITPRRARITGVDALLKAALDYVGAALGLLALSPLLAAIAALVRLDSPGPALHRRRVLGQGGREFDALKFRTMVVDADAVLAANPELREAFGQGQKLKVDPRVTRLGRLLRRASLDELPQLVNVLRGQMSLVGPRMIAPDEAARYGKWQLNLLTVKPGLTGPWQVRGRADLPYDERVRLSMRYIRDYSLWLDLEILLRTAAVVLRGKGAY